MIGTATQIDESQVGMFIRLVRKRKKLTQEEMAKKIGVSRDTYMNWEKGQGLNIKNIRMIGEIMNVKFAIVVFE